MMIRDATLSDAAAITEIYNHYILTAVATFELETIDAVDMQRRINDAVDKGLPFLVGEHNNSVAGYAYGRPFRPRPGYRHAVEISVYVHPERHGQGIARALYGELIPRLFDNEVHTLIATIALPNDASVRLHEKFGFTKIGQFQEVGRKFDRWVDVGYWQLLRRA
jgi:phosphinothricin acetyltransferase